MSDTCIPTWSASRQRYRSYARSGHLGFGVELHQRIRYEALLRHVDPTGAHVLDFGCGHAGLLRELLMRGRVPAHYHGYDLLPENTQEAQRRSLELIAPGGLANFACFDNELDESYDIVCALAVFSVDEGENCLELWAETLRDLWQRTRRHLVFDLLRVEPGFEHAGHRRLSLAGIAEIASGFGRSQILDSTFADHFTLVVCNREETASRRYWHLREPSE